MISLLIGEGISVVNSIFKNKDFGFKCEFFSLKFIGYFANFFSLFMLSDGYTLRNSFMIMKGEIDVTTMILSPTGIEISFVNENKCGVHDVVLHASEFSMYRYDFRDEEGNLLPSILSLLACEMFNPTKNIGRKDGVRIIC